jgi:hypothetical protein
MFGGGGLAHSELEASGFTLSLNYSFPNFLMEVPLYPCSSSVKTFTLFSSKCNNSDRMEEDVTILSKADVLTSREITYKNTDQRHSFFLLVLPYSTYLQ